MIINFRTAGSTTRILHIIQEYLIRSRKEKTIHSLIYEWKTSSRKWPTKASSHGDNDIYEFSEEKTMMESDRSGQFLS